jgi:hypothetical protein
MQQILESKMVSLLDRQKELISELKVARDIYHTKRFEILEELLRIGVALDKNYTCLDLAKDVNMSPQNVYLILSYKKANKRTRRLVARKKISFDKVVRTIKHYGKGIEDNDKQNEVFDVVIDKDMSREEIETKMHKMKKGTCDIDTERQYVNEWNIARDVNVYCFRLHKTLLSVDKVPVTKRDKVRADLMDINKEIESAIERLR